MKRTLTRAARPTTGGVGVKRRRLVALLAVAWLLAALPPAPAGAASFDGRASKGERHCVLTIDAVDADGTFIEGDLACSSSYAVANALVAEAQSMSRSSTLTIGRHFTGEYYTGSSITIVGSVLCGGGVWRPSGSWNDNIESTYHYCGPTTPTRFYNSSTCSGSNSAAFARKATMGWMKNATSCVRYG